LHNLLKEKETGLLAQAKKGGGMNEVRVGQVWKDNQDNREVEVIAIDRPNFKARIITKAGRRTWADMKRFDGTKPSRGYSFVRSGAERNS
jgi:hypothetical protein